MGLIKYFKDKKRAKEAKYKEVKENAALYKKINEVGEKNVPLDCVTFLFCIDPSRPEDERGYSQGSLKFDYIIPVIKSGNKYFNIITLEEIDPTKDIDINTLEALKFPYSRSIYNNNALKIIDKEDIKISGTSEDCSNGFYNIKISANNSFHTKIHFYDTKNNYNPDLDFINISTLRDICGEVNVELFKNFKDKQKRKENKQKSKDARDFVNSL